MLQKYVKDNFNSYDDFIKNLSIKVPDNFNFAYDIVDAWADKEPDKKALVWCDDSGRNAEFTFKDIKIFSNKAANFFKSLGIKKGDPVMLILKRHYEFWFCIIALHKIGAVCIPATHLLTKKDLIYRNNAADIKMIVSVSEKDVLDKIDESQGSSPTLKLKVVVGTKRDGWHNFEDGIEKAPDKFERPAGMESTVNSDMMLLYFTSGTTGMPKMVQHNYTYPLGHIITSRFWQNIKENGLHLTVSDTGWAKAVWGKLYGQWICGCAIFVYDYDKFIPKDLLNVISKYEVTSFCAPPTIYRYLIKEDLTKYNFKALKYCSVAGEPLNPEVYSQFLKLTGIKLMEGYGQTEAVVMVATFPG